MRGNHNLLFKFRTSLANKPFGFVDARRFNGLRPSPARSGDRLAGSPGTQQLKERAIAQMTLADVPLSTFPLSTPLFPYEKDEINGG